MSTIVTINSGDLITNSRADINSNFANLNSDKIETSVLDTDTALAANSDAKIPSQKAVKTYVDTLGNVNASEIARGIVEEATDAEVTAGTATGGTGAKLFLTPAKLATRMSSLIKFGGTGADGALTISSGTTTIDLASASVVVKNYSSISITGTGSLAFSNPASTGTIIIIKCSGNATITSSANPAIDLRSLGGAAGAAAGSGDVAAQASTAGSSNLFVINAPTDTGGGKGYTTGGSSLGFLGNFRSKLVYLATGAGGAGGGRGVAGNYGNGGGGGAGAKTAGASGGTSIASGSAGTAGAGGRGAGALYIECAGAYSCSSTINAGGVAGSNFGSGGGAGGGGGGGGTIYILYTTLTSDTGTYTVSGGAGGTGALNNGGAGGDGYSLVALNTEFA